MNKIIPKSETQKYKFIRFGFVLKKTDLQIISQKQNQKKRKEKKRIIHIHNHNQTLQDAEL
jgi:hypothetical protein